MVFKKGDVVRIINDYSKVSIGMVGTIIEERNCDGLVGVKFNKSQIKKDEEFYFHSLNGLLNKRLGRWYSKEDLELIKSKKGNRYYEF